MESESSTTQTDSALTALACRRRRVALATLVEQSSPVPVEKLGAHVAATLHETPVDDVDDDAREREHVSLVHRHLPKLDDANLVEWDREGGVVAANGRGALTESAYRRVIDSPDEEWDAILESLSHRRRRVVLSILVDHGSAIARRNLARRTVARERNVETADVSADAVDDVVTSLYHVHLPKLREAGLLVDDDLETVRYAGHPDLDEESLTVESTGCAPRMALVAQ